MISGYVMEIMLREGAQLVILTSEQDRKLALGDYNNKQRKEFPYYCTC
jgi:hypothetical protein